MVEVYVDIDVYVKINSSKTVGHWLLAGILLFFGLTGQHAFANPRMLPLPAQGFQSPIGEINRHVMTIKESPKIVHIVNFIRLLEPRDPAITEEVLYQTVVSQVQLMRKFNLNGTFLLQYDALLDNRYQSLLKNLPKNQFEIGGWLEVPEPLAKNAGLAWRGHAPWDSRADVDFTTGYTQAERIKLIDTYMAGFKKVFDGYPKTVGCWYLDAFSLEYMYKKYGVIASCNCKDQIGTDGYTLWGGYWNQAYYPSKRNAYMPAQSAEGQIPVPVFRMLGSDPIRQYDDGIADSHQGVITLEPVYKFGGGDSVWVNWFLKTLTGGASMAFGYTQAGQENSFTWKAMEQGLNYQFQKLAALQSKGKLQVETMSKTAMWFKNRFKVTPVTSVTALEDLPGMHAKTVWVDSRYYRLNLLWQGAHLKVRDIHLFDQNLSSPYYDAAATGPQCSLFTLPFIDGHFWSSKENLAGLQFLIGKDGQYQLMQGLTPIVKNKGKGSNKANMLILWPLKEHLGTLSIAVSERYMSVRLMNAPKGTHWKLRLNAAATKAALLPFIDISPSTVRSEFMGHDYTVQAKSGRFVAGVDLRAEHQHPIHTNPQKHFGKQELSGDTIRTAFEVLPTYNLIRLDFGIR